jgi:hypothetical protein
VFENRVLTRIFGPKKAEVMGAGENCIMRSFITCILCSANGEKRNAYRISVGKPEGKRPTGET